jgi:hypothetical protein
MQRAVYTTVEEEVFSMRPPTDYISSPVVNQQSVSRWKRKRMERVQSSPSDLWCICVRLCVCVCVCVREREREAGPIRPLHRDHHWSIVLPLWLSLYQAHISNEMQDFTYGGRHKSRLVPWRTWPGWRNLNWAIASRSHRICVTDSSSSRHPSQVGSSVNLKLKRCPFRWQCSLNSPIIHINWSLFNFNRSFVLLAEGPDISPFVWVQLWIPVVLCDFCSSSPWPLSWQLRLRCHRLVQVLWTDVQILFVLVDLLFHFQQYPHDLEFISIELCYGWPLVWWFGGNPRPVLRWSCVSQVLQL